MFSDKTLCLLWQKNVCLVVRSWVSFGANRSDSWWAVSISGKALELERGELPYLLKVTVFSLPSYAVLGVTLSILVLAMTSVGQKQVAEFDRSP